MHSLAVQSHDKQSRQFSALHFTAIFVLKKQTKHAMVKVALHSFVAFSTCLLQLLFFKIILVI